MKMFSDSDDYRSEMSISEVSALKRRLAHVERHGRLEDTQRIQELERSLDLGCSERDDLRRHIELLEEEKNIG